VKVGDLVERTYGYEGQRPVGLIVGGHPHHYTIRVRWLDGSTVVINKDYLKVINASR